MVIPEARNLAGGNYAITYRDRSGHLRAQGVYVQEIRHTATGGVYLAGDAEDISLDNVTSINYLK